MKKYYTVAFFCMLADSAYAQSDKRDKSGFWDRVRISESMETAEQKEKPAQFQVTIPKDGSASWMFNTGISYALSSNLTTSVQKISAEYHRNTLTDKEQNNFQAGYALTQLLSKNADNGLYLNADAQYAYDGVDIKNSVASSLLLTWYKDASEKGLSFNALNFFDASSLFLSGFGGVQLQGIFDAKDAGSKGFIVRPLYVLAVQYNINKKDSSNKKDSTKFSAPKAALRFSVDYTGRVDAINSTSYREHYTQQLKVGADYFLTYEPVKVSIGASYNYGSDPFKGLKQQQYWLLSLNFGK